MTGRLLNVFPRISGQKKADSASLTSKASAVSTRMELSPAVYPHVSNIRTVRKCGYQLVDLDAVKKKPQFREKIHGRARFSIPWRPHFKLTPSFQAW